MSTSRLATQIAAERSWDTEEAAVEVIADAVENLGVAPVNTTADAGSDASKVVAVQGVTGAKPVAVSSATLATEASLAKTIPATTAAAVTPSDSTALTSRAVWVGGGGDLSVRLSGATGTTVVFTNVPDGSLLPISVVRIMAATTATDIVVLN